MKMRQKCFVLISGVVASLAISSTLMAAELPAENRLPAWDDYGTETVDFTNIGINYRNGKSRKGVVGDSKFFGESTATSIFNLNGPDDRGTIFEGYMVIDAQLSSRGKLRDASSFAIYSTDGDAKFAGYETDYNCNKKGKNCSTGNLVYGGDLTSFGWSSSQGILEFTIANLSGWSVDTWLGGDQSARVEHLMLSTDPFDLGGVSSVKTFTAIADGFVVVPVPAAAWLFGSGLIGLVGFARRKRVQA